MISAAVWVVERARQAGILPTLLVRVLAAGVDEVICVTDDLSGARREIGLSDRRLFWYPNDALREGQSSSVIGALWASDPRSSGLMIIAADELDIPRELIDSLLDKFTKTGASIVAANFAGRPRSPFVFRRDLFPELLKLTGDDIGQSLLERHAKKTALVDWPDDVSLPNVPHRQSSRRLKKRV